MSVGCLRLCYGCVLPGADSRIVQTCLKFSRHGHGFAVSAMATRDAQGCTGDPQGCLPDEQGLASAVDMPYYTCMWEGGFNCRYISRDRTPSFIQMQTTDCRKPGYSSSGITQSGYSFFNSNQTNKGKTDWVHSVPSQFFPCLFETNLCNTLSS